MSEHPRNEATQPPRTLDVRAGDLDRLLALNNQHAAELSLLDAAGFERLVRNAFLARQSADADAFVVAFDQDGDYDSPNFLWFRSRFERFVYVDRVVVAPAARGRGLAKALYDSVTAAAESAKSGRIVCEINLDPPNPASIGFHEALGFRQIGRAVLDAGGKTVGYYERVV
ncbi:GNAT family N-acetyltransferase [Jiella avicenniae]|uniref:GNAT family N-acetyltransferase n=1 Tax=Jiella avicenniae TaxID=2907202 RepID=A0A9X1P143_9HYPH|nr:GNAT family N-acetyltransferase [Jiella avicenniae]MCE7028598.1 GNAT family N-acetyltransferase [Jiella avicenniae]